MSSRFICRIKHKEIKVSAFGMDLLSSIFAIHLEETLHSSASFSIESFCCRLCVRTIIPNCRLFYIISPPHIILMQKQPHKQEFYFLLFILNLFVTSLQNKSDSSGVVELSVVIISLILFSLNVFYNIAK